MKETFESLEESGNMQVSPDAINNNINGLMIYLSFICLLALLFISIHRFLSNLDIRPNFISLGTKGQLSRKSIQSLAFFNVCQ
jgi:hypothetical protein